MCIPPSEKEWILRLPGLAEALKKRRVSDDNLDKACLAAWSVSLQCAGSPAEVLESLGYSVEEDDLRVCGVIVRGRADMDLKKVFIDRASAEEITAKLEAVRSKAEAREKRSGLSWPPGAEVIAAHELFHIMEPSAPSAIAELAANIFASLYLRLPFYADTL